MGKLTFSSSTGKSEKALALITGLIPEIILLNPGLIEIAVVEIRIKDNSDK